MKKFLSLCCVTLVAVLFFSGCSKTPDPDNITELQFLGPADGDIIVTFETSKGIFKAVLYPAEAPLAVENFVALAERGEYDGLEFHRVIADFIIQSGATESDESSFGASFRNEYSRKLYNYRGALGMANDEPNQNSCQFYIVQGKAVSQNFIDQMQQQGYAESVIDTYKKYGGAPTLDNRYTVFGQVYEGLDIVEAISKVKTDSNDHPNKAVTINKITVETYRETLENGSL